MRIFFKLIILTVSACNPLDGQILILTKEIYQNESNFLSDNVIQNGGLHLNSYFDLYSVLMQPDFAITLLANVYLAIDSVETLSQT